MQGGGSFGSVQAKQIVLKQEMMYNLTVEKAHTFFVGQDRWLVHNTCPNPFDNLAQTRQHLGLPAASSEGDAYTLARLDVHERSFYGINASGMEFERPVGVNTISPKHAEGDAFGQANLAGIRSGEATLYVDRLPCSYCRSSFAGYAKQLDLSKLTVIGPNGYRGEYTINTGKYRTLQK